MHLVMYRFGSKFVQSFLFVLKIFRSNSDKSSANFHLFVVSRSVFLKINSESNIRRSLEMQIVIRIC